MASTEGIRCTNPKCGAKIAESLNGTLVIKCRQCGLTQTISR